MNDFHLFSLSESKRPAVSEEPVDDLTVLKSLDGSHKFKETNDEVEKKDEYLPDESDSTKSRRLAEEYDSTKNGMEHGKYQAEYSHSVFEYKYRYLSKKKNSPENHIRSSHLLL